MSALIVLTLPALAGAAITPTLDTLTSGASGSITAAFSNPPDPAGYSYNAVRCVDLTALNGGAEPDPATWTRWGSPPPATQITASPATRTGFVDDHQYKCYVTEVDQAGAVSARSNMLTVTVGPVAPPPPPPSALWGTDFETGAFEAYKATIRRDGAGATSAATRSITTEQARTGSKSAKIVMPASTSSSGSARYQMVANIPNGGEGTDRWYGWSVMLGTNWAGTGCALTQLTDNSSYFMGQGGFRYVMPEPNPNGPGANPGLDGNLPGRWSIGLNLTSTVGGDDDQQRDLGPLCEGVWKDFVIHVKWSSGSDGVFETYADGGKVGPTYSGRTLGTAGGYFEHRMGLYQGSSVNHTRTLYLDNHRVGTSYAAVDPSR